MNKKPTLVVGVYNSCESTVLVLCTLYLYLYRTFARVITFGHTPIIQSV
jgi:hypothetical protein